MGTLILILLTVVAISGNLLLRYDIKYIPMQEGMRGYDKERADFYLSLVTEYGEAGAIDESLKKIKAEKKLPVIKITGLLYKAFSYDGIWVRSLDIGGFEDETKV